MQSWRDQLRRPRAQISAAVIGVLAVIVGVLAVRSLSSSTPYGQLPPPVTASRLEAEPSAATPPAGGTPFRLLTPGPTVPAGHWRWKGLVLDQDSNPLAGVCVHIGPGDCRFNSIRTDDQGRWAIDFPQVDVIYEFHFVKEGYQTVDDMIRTQAEGELNVRMIPKKP